MKHVKSIVIALIVAMFAAGGVRTFFRASDQRPAFVTPRANLRLDFSKGIVPRTYRVLHDTVAVAHGTRPKLVALTFDDGPYPVFTPLLLDELHDLHVPGTFFLIGRDAQQWPEITARIEAMGNEVADHTYSHPDLDHETPSQVRSEVLRGRDVLWALTHDPAVRTLMRPPHGRFTIATLRAVQSLGYSTVLWTDDSGDWRTLTPQTIEAHLLTHATAPDLVLLHDGKLATIEALPKVVARFRAAGYRFVTVGQLLVKVDAQQLNHPVRHPL